MNGQPGRHRVAVQAWAWDEGQPRYTLHQFVLGENPSGQWSMRHFEVRCRALRRGELAAAAAAAGFRDVRWLEPADSGSYQPILVARRS